MKSAKRYKIHSVDLYVIKPNDTIRLMAIASLLTAKLQTKPFGLNKKNTRKGCFGVPVGVLLKLRLRSFNKAAPLLAARANR